MSEAQIVDPFADDESDKVAATFKPTPIPTEEKKAAEKMAIAAADSVAEKQGFTARKKPKKKSKFRRSDNLRTGRNELISIKGRLEDKERLNAVTEGREWVNGQTLRYALDALQEKIDNPQDKFWQTHNFHGVD